MQSRPDDNEWDILLLWFRKERWKLKTKKKNRPFEYSKLDDKNESKRGMFCDIYPIHLYWIVDTEMIESFRIGSNVDLR